MLHTKPRAELPEQVTLLVYELLDAHDDTARLAAETPLDWRWQVHLSYVRDLQRVGREALAHACHTHVDLLEDERKPRFSRRTEKASRRCARRWA